MARVGVEAGGLPGGGLVGARGAGGLGRLAGGGDVVAGVSIEAGGLPGGGLVGARGAGRLGRLASMRNHVDVYPDCSSCAETRHGRRN